MRAPCKGEWCKVMVQCRARGQLARCRRVDSCYENVSPYIATTDGFLVPRAAGRVILQECHEKDSQWKSVHRPAAARPGRRRPIVLAVVRALLLLPCQRPAGGPSPKKKVKDVVLPSSHPRWSRYQERTRCRPGLQPRRQSPAGSGACSPKRHTTGDPMSRGCCS